MSPFPWNDRTCQFAATGGHLAVLQWSLDQDCPYIPARMCGYAAEGGHMEVLQWARGSREYNFLLSCNARICSSAAAGGQLEVLRWLHAGAYTRPLFIST